jgi:hypothetical protein
MNYATRNFSCFARRQGNRRTIRGPHDSGTNEVLEEIVDKDIKSTISDFGNHSVTDDREGKQIVRSRGSLYTHPQTTSSTCRKPEKYQSKKDRASNSRCRKSKKKERRRSRRLLS